MEHGGQERDECVNRAPGRSGAPIRAARASQLHSAAAAAVPNSNFFSFLFFGAQRRLYLSSVKLPPLEEEEARQAGRQGVSIITPQQ